MDVLDKSILTTIVTALATAVVASWGYWRNAKADLEKEYSSRFNTKKWEVYTAFTALVPEIIGTESISMDEPVELPSVNSLASQIVIAGSDKVVKSFGVWRETARVYGQGDEETKGKLFHLIAEMRKDLGNKYTHLSNDDLLGALKPGGYQE